MKFIANLAIFSFLSSFLLFADAVDVQIESLKLVVGEGEYVNATDDFTQKGYDTITFETKSPSAFFKDRAAKKENEKCLAELDIKNKTSKKSLYLKAKENFDSEFNLKKEGEPFDAKKLDDLEVAMRKSRKVYLAYEATCGNCVTRMIKLWKDNVSKEGPLYYENDGTCFIPEVKKGFAKKGIELLSKVKTYAKSSLYGLSSIDAYRKYVVRDNKVISLEEQTKEEKEQAPLAYVIPKEIEKLKSFAEHYSFISVTGPKAPVLGDISLGYRYKGWIEPVEVSAKESSSNGFALIFNTVSLDKELASSMPTPNIERVTASGKVSKVAKFAVQTAYGSWVFSEDGVVRYHTAGSFADIFQVALKFDPTFETQKLMPFAAYTLLETVYEITEQLEKL